MMLQTQEKTEGYWQTGSLFRLEGLSLNRDTLGYAVFFKMVNTFHTSLKFCTAKFNYFYSHSLLNVAPHSSFVSFNPLFALPCPSLNTVYLLSGVYRLPVMYQAHFVVSGLSFHWLLMGSMDLLPSSVIPVSLLPYSSVLKR